MQNLEGLTLINCVSTSLFFGNPSDHRSVKLHRLRRLSVNDSPEACAAFNRAISVDDERTAISFGRRYTDQRGLESIAEFMREIPISQRFTALEASARHVDSSKQRNVNFHLHHDFGGASLTLRAIMFRPERGSSALFDSPNWYHDLWTTIAMSLQLQHIQSLVILVDSVAGALTKSTWLKSFSHAKLVTVLDVQSRHILALSQALYPQKTPTRTKISQCLFPRLGLLSLAIQPKGLYIF
ncbi:hypothetical protein PENSPDRAFT_430441 [Peniophora sp. CONT]|nr:hypothetical protein PENSPDRAFT_430441 [Peniophora sp. CONT]